MSVELLQTLSLGAYILAGVFLAVAIALFFLLDVPKLVGFLTGSAARKGIEIIRQQNAGAKGADGRLVNHTGEKTRHRKPPQKQEPSPSLKAERPKPHTEKLAAQTKRTTVLSAARETDVLDESGSAGGTTVLKESEPAGGTTVLKGSEPAGGTTVLKESEPAGGTTVLKGSQPAGETTVLEKSPPTGETTVLEGLTAPPDGQTADGEVAVEVELGFAESTELIE